MSEKLKAARIGVLSSDSDFSNSEKAKQMAEEIGQLVAKAGVKLVFDADIGNFGWRCSDSIARAAYGGAVSGGGSFILGDMNKNLFVLFSRSCDAIIAISNPLIVLTPSPEDWRELRVDYVKTPREAVNVAMERIMVRRRK